MKLWTMKKKRKVVHSEEWFAELYRKLPIAAPEGPHVDNPGEAFLRQLARRSGKPPLSDPRVKHAAQCPYCLLRLRDLQSEAPEERQALRPSIVVAVATLAIVLAAFLSFKLLGTSRRGQQVSSIQTIDLSELGTTRGAGEGNQVPVFRLPRKQDQVTLILPYFSQDGPYRVQVLAERNGPQPVAEASGNAVRAGKTTILKVALDLSEVKSGVYYLATTHGSDEAAYYYPVQIGK